MRRAPAAFAERTLPTAGRLVALTPDETVRLEKIYADLTADGP